MLDGVSWFSSALFFALDETRWILMSEMMSAVSSRPEIRIVVMNSDIESL